MSTAVKPGTSLGLSYALFFFLLVLTIVLLLPIVWLVSASVQGPGAIFQVPFHWIPREWRFDNFSFAWNVGKIGFAFMSSSKTALIAVCVHVSWCTITGYVFAKYRFRFNRTFVTMFLLTMMIPGQVTIFTVYQYAKDLHLINTNLGLALPFFINGAGTFMMLQFAKYVPTEIMESAKMDGCGNWGTFFKISLPQMKAGISALTILMFKFIWDEFPWATLIANSDHVRTLPLALVLFLRSQASNDSSANIPAMLASSVIMFIPVLVIFLIFQKQFIESVSYSAVKG
jgi:ABC-type glycerol-3-phosphate transport system permease component